MLQLREKNRNRSSKALVQVNKWHYVCSRTNAQLTVIILFAHQIGSLSCSFKNLPCGMYHHFLSSSPLPWGFAIKANIRQPYSHSKGFLSNEADAFLWIIQWKTHVTKRAADLKCHLCKQCGSNKMAAYFLLSYLIRNVERILFVEAAYIFVIKRT